MISGPERRRDGQCRMLFDYGFGRSAKLILASIISRFAGSAGDSPAGCRQRLAFSAKTIEPVLVMRSIAILKHLYGCALALPAGRRRSQQTAKQESPSIGE